MCDGLGRPVILLRSAGQVNQPGDDYAALSIAALARRSGIDPFPALSDTVKQAAPDLTAPVLARRGRRTGGR